MSTCSHRFRRCEGTQRIVTVFFALAGAEAFAELPESAKKRAAQSIELLRQHPKMYPVCRRGLMSG